MVADVEVCVPVTSTSNTYDLPSQVRGQAIPVPSYSTLSESTVHQIKSKLSSSVEPFNMPSLPESCDTEKLKCLSIFGGRFSDLRGKFKLFAFEECISPPQTGPSFSTCESLIPIRLWSSSTLESLRDLIHSIMILISHSIMMLITLLLQITVVIYLHDLHRVYLHLLWICFYLAAAKYSYDRRRY